jgi:hypothetical protein
MWIRLCWIYGHTRRNRVWDDDIYNRLEATRIEEKNVEMVCTSRVAGA